MKIVAIIQARMGSVRLPGKVMMPLGKETVLTHVITRVKRAQGIDAIVVATSNLNDDDIIEKNAISNDVNCFRGHETNVLARYYQAALEHEADVIIRITADCPFLDPQLLTNMITVFTQKSHIDYLSNCLIRTYARGFDIEIMKMSALTKAFQEARLSYDQEHVTPYIYQHPDIFHCENIENITNQSQYRLTLDTIEDYHLISAIFNRLKDQDKAISSENILSLLENEPTLLKFNQHLQ